MGRAIKQTKTVKDKTSLSEMAFKAARDAALAMTEASFDRLKSEELRPICTAVRAIAEYQQKIAIAMQSNRRDANASIVMRTIIEQMFAKVEGFGDIGRLGAPSDYSVIAHTAYAIADAMERAGSTPSIDASTIKTVSAPVPPSRVREEGFAEKPAEAGAAFTDDKE